MSGWLRWPRDSAPGLLAAYVQRGVVGKMLGDNRPAPGAGPRLDRARALYEAFTRRDITYAHEAPESDTAGQAIRTPGEVLLHHRCATCLDIAVTYAGGCLDAGLHPLIVIAEPATAGGAFHAFVVVWLGGEYQRPVSFDYPLTALVHQEMPAEVAPVQETNGTFLAIDVTGAAHGYGGRTDPLPWKDAVTAGAELCGRWSFAVDVGLYEGDVLPQPATPANDPLTPPYYRARTRTGPLAELQARRGRIPFAPREELDLLIDWCEAADPQNRTKVTILHGLGGAGKTHLAAELAATMAGQGWHTGFLIRNPDDVQLAWLGLLVSPLLVVVDYAEAVKAEDVNALLRAVRGRAAPTRVVLTARLMGDWWTDIEGLLSADDHDVAVSPRPFEPLHPAPWRVFRLAYRAFTGHDLTAPSPADLPQPAQWTTLDLVLHAWLAAEGVRDLPRGHADRYEEVMRREIAYWQETYRERHASDVPSKHTFWSLGACLALLSPREERVPELITEVLGIDDRLVRDHLADLVEEMLHTESESETVSIRPDPMGAHLLVRPHPRDPELFDRCIDAATDLEFAFACFAISRAAQNDHEKARDLAAAALDLRRDLWRFAYVVAAAQGGPFVPALEALAREPDTPLPLADIAERIPLGHSALGELALIAAQAQVSEEAETSERARTLKSLAIRQAAAGHVTAALATIQEAVTHYRELAEANPATHLPDLAMALNVLSAQQAGTGDRAGALESIQEAVAIDRTLVETDGAAFLPDLAASLHNLSASRAECGDRLGALESIQEAVALRKTFVQTNPSGYLPDLADSLHSLSLRRLECGDRDSALESARDVVALYRMLAEADRAAFLHDVANALNTLSIAQSATGDRVGALESIEEAVAIHRTLIEGNRAASLPDLAMSLHTLSNRQAECGDLVHALQSIEEAVAVRRGLAEANPAASLPKLAGSLNNLSSVQAGCGDRDSALASIEEAVTLLRTLVETNRAAFLPELAGALNNLSSERSANGDRAGALRSVQESVAHYRELIDGNRDGFLPHLASALNTLSSRQFETGDRDGALESSREAVAHYRALAEANREAFLPDLAMSLQNMSVQQSAAGDRIGALEPIQEAVAHYHALVEAQGYAFVPSLAGALNTLSNRQAETGDRQGALASVQEAVGLRRAMVEVNRAAFLPDLAMSLHTLSARQAECGYPDGALESIREAVAHYRALAEVHRAAFLPDLAALLGSLSARQAATGDRDGALEPAQEAVAIHRALAEVDRAAFLPGLAESLHTLSNRLAERGDRDGALASIQEAVTHLRSSRKGGAFLPELAGMLNTLSDRQAECLDRGGALESIREAVAHLRTLVETKGTAFLPELAGTLNNLSVWQSDDGELDGAWAPIQEAVAHCRALAEAEPAAFLTDLIRSLNTLAALSEKLGRGREATGVWSEIASGLRPGAQAECLAHLVARQFAGGRRSAAVKTLTRAVQCADADEDPQWRGRARRALQRVGAQLAAEDKKPEKWPSWVVSDLSDEEMERLNRWLTAADWETKAAYLRAEYTTLSGEDGRSALDLAQAWYPEFPGLQELSGLLDAIDDGGLDQVLDLLTAHNRRVLLTRAWLSSADWDQSRAFLRENSKELAHPETVALLKGTEDEIAHQHAAILELLESLELDEVFDAVTDVTVAADHGYRFLEAGAWIKLAPLSRAVPHLMMTPFVSPFLAAVAAVLRGTPEDGSDPEAWMRTAAEAATDTQRRAGVARLRRMTRRFPQQAAALERLTALLEAEPAET